MMIFFQTNPTTIFVLLLSLILSSHHFSTALESEVDDEIPYTYTEGSGKGPKKWGQIDPHWKVCGNGKMQSPIDILDKRVQVFPTLGKLKRDYKPAPAVVMNRGHDIAVKWKQDAGKININGTNYKLQQCHWHSPSEHTFNGSRYDLELHVVHKSSSGKFAVVGIVYKYGHPDPFLSKVRTVSREQVHALREAVHDGFEENARPTQQSGGIGVEFYTPRENGGST
ncbi:alpha carbonic anhydrase 4-like isoform X2 [Corylus avellana]|uniref:alpha carbonic anhydrase 4-like isoform X2 n=1 Tax=Corylus avellana TaxID=13451 RepID=UPI00286C489D|nr:alpha carbonic anhydrase 4-like isoform X2 [Corylus avellana]